jgi:FkbM family methyltransferase
MSELFSPRRWKQTVAPLIPETLKAHVRGRLFGFRPSRRAVAVDFGVDETGPVVSIDGLSLRFSQEDMSDLRFHLLANGESTDELGSFIELARSASVLFDVGAYKGLFSHLFCLVGKANRAVAFEPSARIVLSAEAWADANGTRSQTLMRLCAVGRTISQLSARIDETTGALSVSSPCESGEQVDVQMTTLDEEVQRLGLVPDLIKIDVEGFEWEVLCGARQLLRTHKPAICLELHLDMLERRGVSPQLVVDELVSHGYTFRDCTGTKLSARRIARSPKALFRFVAV